MEVSLRALPCTTHRTTGALWPIRSSTITKVPTLLPAQVVEIAQHGCSRGTLVRNLWNCHLSETERFRRRKDVKNCAKKGNSAFRNWTDIFDGRARSGGDKVGPRARRDLNFWAGSLQQRCVTPEASEKFDHTMRNVSPPSRTRPTFRRHDRVGTDGGGRNTVVLSQCWNACGDGPHSVATEQAVHMLLGPVVEHSESESQVAGGCTHRQGLQAAGRS